jgi:hypothetical protein
MLPTVAILILVVALICLFVLVDVAKSLRELLKKRESVPKWDELIGAMEQLTSQMEEWPENSRLDLRLRGGCGPFQHYGRRLDENYRLDHYRLDRLDPGLFTSRSPLSSRGPESFLGKLEGRTSRRARTAPLPPFDDAELSVDSFT